MRMPADSDYVHEYNCEETVLPENDQVLQRFALPECDSSALCPAYAEPGTILTVDWVC